MKVRVLLFLIAVLQLLSIMEPVRAQFVIIDNTDDDDASVAEEVDNTTTEEEEEDSNTVVDGEEEVDEVVEDEEVEEEEDEEVEEEEEEDPEEVVAIEDLEFQWRKSQPIADQIYYNTCNLTSGFDFVVLACKESFEVYDTADLAKGSGLTENYGNADPIVGVHNSLATDQSGSVTYVHFNRGINRIERDAETNQLVRETIVNLVIPTTDTVTDAYVLDGVVAVQINGTAFHFFPIPLIKGQYVDEIPINPIVDQKDNFTERWEQLLTYTFAPNQKSPEFILYGALDGQLVKINYTYDDASKSINMEVEKEDLRALDNAKFVELQATTLELIISIADGFEPGIYFLNFDLKREIYFETESMNNSTLALAVYQPEGSTILQVSYSTPQSISIIQRAINTRTNEHVYELMTDVHTVNDTKSLVSSNDFISVSKGNQYLIYKESSSEFLGVVPMCTQNTYFDNETFTCEPCQVGLRSYGMQEDMCVSCMRMWITSTQTVFANNLWNQLCTEGNTQSIALLVITPLLACIISCCCCFFSASNGFQGKSICDDIKEQDELKRKNMVNKNVRKVYRRKSRLNNPVTNEMEDFINSQPYPMESDRRMMDDQDDNADLEDINARIKEREMARQYTQQTQKQDYSAQNDHEFNRDNTEELNGQRVAGDDEDYVASKDSIEDDSGDVPVSGIKEEDVRKTVQAIFDDQSKADTQKNNNPSNPYNPYAQ